MKSEWAIALAHPKEIKEFAAAVFNFCYCVHFGLNTQLERIAVQKAIDELKALHIPNKQIEAMLVECGDMANKRIWDMQNTC